MDEKSIKRLGHALGVKKFNYVKNNIIFPCVLAPWTHQKGTDRRPSMEIKINPNEESVFFCFTCKKGGTLTSLLMQLNAYTQGKYKDLETQVIEHETDLGMSTISECLNEEFLVQKHEVKKIFDPNLAKKFAGRVPQYILNRGISLETCKRWSLGYDENASRVVFPVYDWFADLVGMVGRTVDNSRISDTYPKFDNYWHFNKSEFLYGEHLLEQRHPHIIVVEGMISALAADQAGLGNVVGLMGSSLNASQKKKLLTIGRTIYVMTDMDKAGEQCRRKFVEEFKNLELLHVVELPEEDPAECTQDQLRQALTDAKKLVN